jgi:hypothetical protein
VRASSSSLASSTSWSRGPWSCCRYLKYLSKKYLKKLQLKDYLHVVANNAQKNVYELKYYKITAEDADEE